MGLNLLCATYCFAYSSFFHCDIVLTVIMQNYLEMSRLNFENLEIKNILFTHRRFFVMAKNFQKTSTTLIETFLRDFFVEFAPLKFYYWKAKHLPQRLGVHCLLMSVMHRKDLAIGVGGLGFKPKLDQMGHSSAACHCCDVSSE